MNPREATDTRPTQSKAEVPIRLLAESELATILPLIQTLNPDVPAATLATRLEAMREGGYRCVGAFSGERCIAVAGLWFGTRFWCGRYVDIDNVVVEESWRRRGIGQALMAWIEDYARRQGCEKAVLDAYVSNEGAHRFYRGCGYRTVGFHFDRDLKQPADQDHVGTPASRRGTPAGDAL